MPITPPEAYTGASSSATRVPDAEPILAVDSNAEGDQPTKPAKRRRDRNAERDEPTWSPSPVEEQ
jgi:hypothetical protein